MSSKTNSSKLPENVMKAVLTKTIYVGKDGITLKQAIQLADLGYKILFR